MRGEGSSESSIAAISEKGLPDLPDQPTSPGLRQRIRQICLHLWIWELLSLLLCTSCVGAIIIILLRYDGQQLPNWSFGLTINGVISVLAGIAKASMILPVAESISQLKWYWFWTGQPRPILDFEHLDTASRGPWGCLMLLCRPRQWGVVSLGALITVTALIMEPSLQFIPSYPSRLTTGGHALISTAIQYKDVNYGTTSDPINYGRTMDSYTLGSSTKKALYKIIYGMTNDKNGVAGPTCSTGNCTWPTFSSLAVCSACADLSDKVYLKEDPTVPNWWLPNGAYIEDSSLFGTHDKHETMAYNATAKQAFFDVFYMYRSRLVNGTKNKPRAAECILYFCVREYTTKVTAGVYSEEVLSSWPGPDTPVHGAPDLSAVRGFVPSEKPDDIDLVLHPPGQDREYRVNWLALWLLRDWVSDIMGDTGYSGATLGDSSNMGDIAQAMHEVQVESNGDDQSGPERVFATIANGFTAAVRQQGNSSTAVPGKALREESYVKARWGWAILPITLVVLACCFMTTTLVLTACNGLPIWKSSALATLAHGLGEKGSTCGIAANRLDVIEEKARGHKMAMQARQQTWRFEGSKI